MLWEEVKITRTGSELCCSWTGEAVTSLDGERSLVVIICGGVLAKLIFINVTDYCSGIHRNNYFIIWSYSLYQHQIFTST